MKRELNLLAALIIPILFASCSKDDVNPESISAKILYSVTTADNRVYTEIDTVNKEVQLFIPFKSEIEIDKIPLSIEISSKATSNLISGTDYDLTEPFNLVITAKDNSKANYTITAHKCNIDKVAVLLSDTQIDLLPLYNQSSFFNNVNYVLSVASNSDIPIYYSMVETIKNTIGWGFPEELQPKNGKIVDKPNIKDAFEVISFRIDLLKKGIGTVYIMGISSSGCVKGTCIGAINNGFNLYLVKDAHTEPIRHNGSIVGIGECNTFFTDVSGVTLILAKDVSFN